MPFKKELSMAGETMERLRHAVSAQWGVKLEDLYPGLVVRVGTEANVLEVTPVHKNEDGTVVMVGYSSDERLLIYPGGESAGKTHFELKSKWMRAEERKAAAEMLPQWKLDCERIEDVFGRMMSPAYLFTTVPFDQRIGLPARTYFLDFMTDEKLAESDLMRTFAFLLGEPDGRLVLGGGGGGS